jgi:4-oxalocrotonate tautomerase
VFADFTEWSIPGEVLSFLSGKTHEGEAMPYILIQLTGEPVTTEQKQTLIRGATDLVVETLKKDPATTFVVIDEVPTDNWGVGGISVTQRRKGNPQ